MPQCVDEGTVTHIARDLFRVDCRGIFRWNLYRGPYYGSAAVSSLRMEKVFWEVTCFSPNLIK